MIDREQCIYCYNQRKTSTCKYMSTFVITIGYCSKYCQERDYVFPYIWKQNSTKSEILWSVCGVLRNLKLSNLLAKQSIAIHESQLMFQTKIKYYNAIVKRHLSNPLCISLKLYSSVKNVSTLVINTKKQRDIMCNKLKYNVDVLYLFNMTEESEFKQIIDELKINMPQKKSTQKYLNVMIKKYSQTQIFGDVNSINELIEFLNKIIHIFEINDNKKTTQEIIKIMTENVSTNIIKKRIKETPEDATMRKRKNKYLDVCTQICQFIGYAEQPIISLFTMDNKNIFVETCDKTYWFAM